MMMKTNTSLILFISTLALAACSEQVTDTHIENKASHASAQNVQQSEQDYAQRISILIKTNDQPYKLTSQTSPDMRQKMSQDFNYNGDRFFQENAFDEAIEQYKHALTINPEYAQAWSNLGFTLIRQHKYADAILASKETIRHADSDSESVIKASGHYNLATIYKEQKRWQEALDNYKAALTFREHPAYKEGILAMEKHLKK